MRETSSHRGERGGAFMEQDHKRPIILRHEILGMGDTKSCKRENMKDHVTMRSIGRRALHYPCTKRTSELAALSEQCV